MARWYEAEGLRFECTCCGDCCRGEPGFVWITRAEIAGMAASLGIGEEEFRSRYVRTIVTRSSLRERPGGDCVLWEEGRGCAVYGARPEQCRTFPFWGSNLVSRSAWESVAAECPGAGAGRRYSADEIRRIAYGEADACEDAPAPAAGGGR